MNIKEILKDVFEEGTEEFEVISDCYELITKKSPAITSEARLHLTLLDRARIQLSTMYFMLCRNISSLKGICQETYDSQYTRLVKLGRPSNAAIEAEIRTNDKTYAGTVKRIEALEQVKELIISYIKCIDSNKKTATEILIDSRRVD